MPETLPPPAFRPAAAAHDVVAGGILLRVDSGAQAAVDGAYERSPEAEAEAMERSGDVDSASHDAASSDADGRPNCF